MSLRQCLHVLRTQAPRRVATSSANVRAFSSSPLARNILPGAPIPDTPTPAPAASAAAPPKPKNEPAPAGPQTEAAPAPDAPQALSVQRQLELLPDGSAKALYHYAQCYHCGDLGHLFYECPRKNKAPACHRCRKPGHVATQCPEPRLTPDEMRTALLKSGAFEARFKGELPRRVVRALRDLEATNDAADSKAASAPEKTTEKATASA
ncbi:hypothetical protein AURDEDRAFT_116973 [Auricularia subglabra TFB-10046 SS5]|uniref:CCHC-type domain-containing protein n=1 Tax=Auricularia subglabra (strain TFB-10046 / SS5) TaxID=717982 RepID=J0WTM4_AURST|nr:hypothetical protein AURDEDRAFT_116973 [Auricularia subglabra TFB-10046 SS5]